MRHMICKLLAVVLALIVLGCLPRYRETCSTSFQTSTVRFEGVVGGISSSAINQPRLNVGGNGTLINDGAKPIKVLSADLLLIQDTGDGVGRIYATHYIQNLYIRPESGFIVPAHGKANFGVSSSHKNGSLYKRWKKVVDGHAKYKDHLGVVHDPRKTTGVLILHLSDGTSLHGFLGPFIGIEPPVL